MLTTSIVTVCDEREWCTDYRNPNWVLVYFNSVIKRVKQCCLYAYFTPKVGFKRKFNHHKSFLYEWRLTARTIRKFPIGPSIRIESRIGRTIRNRIESRSFAGPVPNCEVSVRLSHVDKWLNLGWQSFHDRVGQRLVFSDVKICQKIERYHPLVNYCLQLGYSHFVYSKVVHFCCCGQSYYYWHNQCRWSNWLSKCH